jgi:hypothetical protein
MASVVTSTSATGQTGASKLFKTQAGQTFYRGALLVKGVDDGFLPQESKEAKIFHALPMGGAEVDAAIEAAGRGQWENALEESEWVSF